MGTAGAGSFRLCFLFRLHLKRPSRRRADCALPGRKVRHHKPSHNLRYCFVFPFLLFVKINPMYETMRKSDVRWWSRSVSRFVDFFIYFFSFLFIFCSSQNLSNIFILPEAWALFLTLYSRNSVFSYLFKKGGNSWKLAGPCISLNDSFWDVLCTAASRWRLRCESLGELPGDALPSTALYTRFFDGVSSVIASCLLSNLFCLAASSLVCTPWYLRSRCQLPQNQKWSRRSQTWPRAFLLVASCHSWGSPIRRMWVAHNILYAWRYHFSGGQSLFSFAWLFDVRSCSR